MGEQVFPSSSVLAAMRSLGVVIPIQEQFVVDGSENFRVRIACSLANVTVTLQARLLLPDGSIQPLSQTFAPTSDRSINTFDIPIGQGALLNAVMFASVGAPVRGQCFAQLNIIQGMGASATPLGTLIQGYITSFQALAWPASVIENSVDGQGWQHVVVGTTPPPGNVSTVNVPTNARWEVRALFTTLVTTAAAGSRFPFLQLFKNGVEAARIPLEVVPGPTWQVEMTYIQGCTFTEWTDAVASPTLAVAACPYPAGFRLSGGDQVAMNAIILAGDQIGALTLEVEEWLELN